MKKVDYMKGVLATECVNFELIREKLTDARMIRILHAFVGISTESGELLDQFKKHVIYGKDFDEKNVLEELGDLLWYVCLALDSIGESLDSCMRINYKKLKARYPDGFSEDDALNRDLSREKEIIENG